MPWFFAILVLLLGVGTPALQSSFREDSAENDMRALTLQEYLALNADDLEKKAGFRQDLLNALHSGPTAAELQWSLITPEEDDIWRERNRTQFEGVVSPVPAPGTFLLLGTGLAAAAAIRRRIKG